MSESLRKAKAIDFDGEGPLLVRVDRGPTYGDKPVFVDRKQIVAVETVLDSETRLHMKSGGCIDLDVPYLKVLTILGYVDATQTFNSQTTVPEDLRV